MDEMRIERAVAALLTALGRSSKTAAEYRSAASLCRKQAEGYSAGMLRCDVEREESALRPAHDRRSASRRQALAELMARYSEMAAKWNELADLYEQKAGGPGGGSKVA